jgi:hypothetical protein
MVTEDSTVMVRPISAIGEKVKPLILAFYKSQEDLAVEREDYEQAALWRDAPISEQPITVEPVKEGDHFRIIE